MRCGANCLTPECALWPLSIWMPRMRNRRSRRVPKVPKRPKVSKKQKASKARKARKVPKMARAQMLPLRCPPYRFPQRRFPQHRRLPHCRLPRRFPPHRRLPHRRLRRRRARLTWYSSASGATRVHVAQLFSIFFRDLRESAFSCSAPAASVKATSISRKFSTGFARICPRRRDVPRQDGRGRETSLRGHA